MYYLNSRYYDPEIGRFINIDEISVLSETQDVLNGINLFAYCQNNPVMFDDETGYFFWFLFIIAIIGSAVISAGADIITQGITKGWDNINWGQVAWSAFTGALSGALMASGVGALGMALIGVAIGFIDSVGYQLIGGASLSEINWLSVGFSTFIGALPGIIGVKGATNAKVLDAGLKNSATFLKAAASYDKVLTKIATGQYKNLAGAAGARAITIRNLQNAWNLANKTTAWNKLMIKILGKLFSGGFDILKGYLTN